MHSARPTPPSTLAPRAHFVTNCTKCTPSPSRRKGCGRGGGVNVVGTGGLRQYVRSRFAKGVTRLRFSVFVRRRTLGVMSMVIAHHLLSTASGWRVPDDLRGSTPACIAWDVIAELGELHYGRK